MLTRKLFRTALRYKAQFLSMVLMIAIGTGVFLGFHIEWKSLEQNADAFLWETKYADYRLYSESGFTEDDLRSVRGIAGVDAASRFLSIPAAVKGTSSSVALQVTEDAAVSSPLVMSGAAYDENGDGIWLSDRFADENGIRLGDTLTLTYLGLEISGPVVGLIKSGENMICVADENQLMPDFARFGFAYVSPQKLAGVLGTVYYPQLHLLSGLEKTVLEDRLRAATGTTLLVTAKEEHIAYAGMQSEAEEGKTMGAVLPVLFLGIAVLTMVTTMHRIAANEKVQIGTLKALGFRDRRILLHYASYGLAIGLAGSALGVALGCLIASFIIGPSGMMSTYLDLPAWKLVMPGFCIPVVLASLAFLTLISYLSVKRMLRGTAADALRPYTPKAVRKSAVESLPLWSRLSFGTRWNIRDILRHKSRSAMTLLGVFGCMLLLVGGLGMRDTMERFLSMLDRDISHYRTKLLLTESADNDSARALADRLDGDWQASVGVRCADEAVTLEVYHAENDRIRFLTEDNEALELSDDGVYLCLRLKDTAKIGDMISFSPYGSDQTYTVRVAGYLRSLMSECIVMTDACADSAGVPYRIGSIYTDAAPEAADAPIIADRQDKAAIMATYDTFLEIMNLMIGLLVAAAVLLGVVVLSNLGIMNYVERYRELATLKVLGFREQALSRLLITQNVWLTLLGVAVGLPGGAGVLYILITALAREYELSLAIGWRTCIVSIALTLGVSLLVSRMVARKNKKIDMVEALKDAA